MWPLQGWAQLQDEPLEEEQVREQRAGHFPGGSCVMEHPRGKWYQNEIKVSESA